MMTKNKTGKFFALKLCGLLPAVALPVALFGLTTAEVVSPENPETAVVATIHSNTPDTTVVGYGTDKRLVTMQKDTAKTAPTPPKINEEEKVYLNGEVEVNPEFPGGQNEMMKFIYENLKYPKEAVDRKIHGRVTVKFVVEADGNIENIEVSKSADPLLDEEAVRVVKAMPKWTPGKHKGKTVNVRFFLPIVFKLQQDKEAK